MRSVAKASGGDGGGFLMGLMVGNLRSSKEEEVDNLRRSQWEKEVGNRCHRRRREREREDVNPNVNRSFH